MCERAKVGNWLGGGESRLSKDLRGIENSLKMSLKTLNIGSRSGRISKPTLFVLSATETRREAAVNHNSV